VRLESDSGVVSNDKPDRARIFAPPPLIALICILLGFAAKDFVSPLPLSSTKTNLQVSAGAALVAFAVAIVASCRRAFVQRGTHLNPYRPTKAIVTDGVYGLSRNPIYVAFLLIVLSFVPFTNSLWFIGSAILTVLLLQFGVVTREEKYLHEKFGAEYDEYCQRVRRWI
jgi:protein-S-isoprenylcysteine O-methyltransferase Ste14